MNALVETANAALHAEKSENDAIGLFHENLTKLTRMLDRHLLDEEDIVVLVILRYGAGGLA